MTIDAITVQGLIEILPKGTTIEIYNEMTENPDGVIFKWSGRPHGVRVLLSDAGAYLSIIIEMERIESNYYHALKG